MKRFIFTLILLLLISISFAQKQKVIFDCDLGGDIDDAFALTFLLASPEIDLLGITMDHGRTADRALVACKMLYETGLENIPVFVGRETTSGEVGKDTIMGYSRQFYWAKGFEKVKPQKKPAAEFIVETLNKYPGEVILIVVGPLPNITDILKKDPNVLKKAKKIVAMFGSFYVGYGGTQIPSAEWNVKADVESSKKFASSGANIIYAGLDITDHVKFEEAQRLQLLMRQSPMTNSICSLYSLWRNEWRNNTTPTLFDAVAVGMIIWPDLFTTRKVYVEVIDGGFTIIDESKKPNSEIGISINKDEFLKRLMNRYLTQNLERK